MSAADAAAAPRRKLSNKSKAGSSPSLVHKPEGPPAADRILREDLPAAVEEFKAAYGGLTYGSLIAPAQPAAARRLGQVARHLRDVSWPLGLSNPQGVRLVAAWEALFPALQALLLLGAKLESKENGQAGFHGAVMLVLEVAAAYLALAGALNAPMAVLVEEVGVAAVQVLRQGMRQLVLPMLSEKKGAAAGYKHAEVAEACSAAATLLTELHEFMCRHRLPEEMMFLLVSLSSATFFSSEPSFRLCAAAEELLVTLFCRREAFRSSILQELFAGAPRLASGKRAKKFQLPVAEDHPDFGMSVFTRLLCRLVQSTCLPLHESLGSEVDFAFLVSQRAAAQSIVVQLMSGLFQRLLLAKAKDEESRAILDDLVEELLRGIFRPPWPGALALVRTAAQQLVGVVQQEKKVDVSMREFALKLLSKVTCQLWFHYVEVEKGKVEMPAWDDKNADAELRNLQHIALRSSLLESKELPWTAAARAVEAWDAELYLKDSEGGLGHFKADVVFMYVTMVHLEDERGTAARMPHGGTSLMAAVFSSGHCVHSRTFLAAEWAEALVRAARSREEDEPHRAIVQQLLAAFWTSKAAFDGEGSSWRCGGGRRVLLPFTVWKVYRQLRMQELETLRAALLDCVVMQANSPQATLRKTAMRTLSELVSLDGRVLEMKAVEETVDMRLRDESSWVRQVSVELLGRVIEGDADAPAQVDDAAKAMLLRFQQTVRGRINDTSVLVRRQASRILSAFVLSHRDHPDVVGVALELMRRSSDSEVLRNLVFGTFELLWPMDDGELTTKQALQFASIVDASKRAGDGYSDMLEELLQRFKKRIASKRFTQGYASAVRRWTTLLLNEFVALSAPAENGGTQRESAVGRQLTRTESAASEGDVLEGGEQWQRRRALLTTLEAFAEVQPREMHAHLRPLAVYLALEESPSPEDRWVAQKACRILSQVLPCVVAGRGLIDHRQVQQDLQALIGSQPSLGVHEATRCLCIVVKYVTGDLGQIAQHLNTAVPGLSHLCDRAEAEAGCLERIQVMYMSRQVWILSSLLESLPIDDWVQKAGDEAGGKRKLPRAALRFKYVGGSVAATVADLLFRLYALGEPQLRAVVVTCMGFFLRGQRQYVKERRVAEVFAGALKAGEPGLCLKALETLASLLAHFGSEADRETRTSAVPGKASAVETAQPLAAHSDVVLGHLALAGSIGPGGPDGQLLRIRAEALSVMKQLHRQGLVNPLAVLPKVFALSFAGEASLAEPACAMLKEVLELRPTLLLNRLDEAFREAFLAVLAGGSGLGEVAGRLAALGEVYAERFRRQKATREAFLRKALREVLRPQSSRGVHERFAELLVAARSKEAAAKEEPESSSAAKRMRRSKPAAKEVVEEDWLAGLPLLQRCQLLYAQFVASAISSLPFVYESEPLLVVFECNHHLSLRAGTLERWEGNQLQVEAPPEASQQGEADAFAEAISILACLLLKKSMKAEYALSAEQCAAFNPKEMRQERLRTDLRPRPQATEEGSAVHARFPTAEWLEMARPVAKAFAKPPEITAHLRVLMEADPWDHCQHGGAQTRQAPRRRKRKAPESEQEMEAEDDLEGRQPETTPAPARGRGGRRGRRGRQGGQRGACSTGLARSPPAVERKGRGTVRRAPQRVQAAPVDEEPDQEDEEGEGSDWSEDAQDA